MSAVKRCPCCDAKMVEYKHSLSKLLMLSFIKVVKFVEPCRRYSFSSITNPESPLLTLNQATNLHKLRYWNLIEKPSDDDRQKGGDWLITDSAIDFITGRSVLQGSVWTYRGKVQRYEGDPVNVTDITGGWKYRPEYAFEAQPHYQQELIL
jgi:hypothetical protein